MAEEPHPRFEETPTELPSVLVFDDSGQAHG